MPEQNASSVLVQSEGAALALLGGIVSGELGPFRQGPLSPAQWAAQRGEPLYRTLRRVRRWQALGVLDVQDTKKRAGRPVRLYGLTSPPSTFRTPCCPLTRCWRASVSRWNANCAPTSLGPLPTCPTSAAPRS
ncbi:hypothetical protein MSS93_06515 [Deinococcus radiodurans]|nr:hypothetical protein MSS93_06515 [Deinococcus radiodurans]